MTLSKRIRKLVGKSRKARRSHRPRCPQLQPLEKRELFVVGLNAVPPAVPSDQFDGVVELRSDNNTLCSGTLLSTGKHVLTAAHCLTDDDGKIDVNNVTVKFRTRGGDPPMTVNRSKFDIHPYWDGASDGDYYGDVAVLELPEIAPLFADRYDLYRGRNEVGKVVDVVGFGQTGDGKRESSLGSGVRRAGQNRVEGTSHGRGGPGRSVLRYDHDTGMGSMEGWAAPGDSGGPLLIDNQVAGVTSYGSETNLFGGSPEFERGEDSIAMRVSSYANWIDSVLKQRQYVVLDMANQPHGNTGFTDSIDTRIVNGMLQVTVNSRKVATVDANSVIRLSLRGSGDREKFKLQNDFNHSVHVLGGGGNDSLYGPDSWNTWRIAGRNWGYLDQRTYFTSIENLIGGTNHDTFEFDARGRVDGDVAGGGTARPDALNYERWSKSVSVNLAAGMATAVGGMVRDVQNVWGGDGRDTLIGNDLANVLHGNGGTDWMYGRGGNDWLYGGDERDYLFGQDGVDTLFGMDGKDWLDGGYDQQRDRLFGGAESDTFVRHYKTVRDRTIRFNLEERDQTDANWAIDTYFRSHHS